MTEPLESLEQLIVKWQAQRKRCSAIQSNPMLHPFCAFVWKRCADELAAEIARLRALVASPEDRSVVSTLAQIRERIKNLQRWSVGDNWGPGRDGDDEECWPEGTEEDADGELVKWSDVLAIIDPPGASCASEAPK